MKRKQFNVKDFVSNEETPVETRDGSKVRILSVDIKDEVFPVVAAVKSMNSEVVKEYTKNGRLYINTETSIDLFFK